MRVDRIVLRDSSAGRWLCFDHPVDVLATRRPSQVLATLEETERRVECERLFAAGFLTYEAAQGFDPSFRTHRAGTLPLICFGLYREAWYLEALPKTTPRPVAAWRMTESREDYFRKIQLIQNQIREGHTYQINYTTRQVASGISDPFSLFAGISAQAPYAAYVDGGDYAILCASPELFFRLDHGLVRCQPMKGTTSRGMTLAQDEELGNWLQRSEKNRAENVMITDMVRNDLGRIAKPGSVGVSELFAVTRYPTVWQMTSTVEARTEAPVSGVLRALFPSASVTGAPKVSSMRLIDTLERFPREVYTGTIGYLTPDRRAQFNVAIRTAVVDKRTGSAFYGVGSGIVADSEPGDEYTECLTKSKILKNPEIPLDFALLETLLWTPDRGIFLLDYHLNRMADSARYFGFSFDRGAAAQALDSLASTFGAHRYRIRLLQHRNGLPTLEHEVIEEPSSSAYPVIALAAQPIDPDNPFLYHKTTRRGVYERAFRSVAGCDDVLLWNSNGFVTETSIANVVATIDGQRVTPPVTCGLLGGTYRQWLLDRGEIREREIHIDALSRVDEFTLINSVRGEIPARLRALRIPAAVAGR
ncbi:MAG: chorismate-binding protein [Rhodospirillaceae bacterium]|nr:chorismate-binding protein [Rhodospirillaceae bacterium]